MLLDAREPEAALDHAERSASMLKALLITDPANANFRRAASIVETQWAAALRGSGQIIESLTHNENAVRMAQALRQDAPKSAQYRIDVGIAERKFSDGHLIAGRTMDAVHHATVALQISCQSSPDTASQAELANCGPAHLALGNAYLALHHAREAVVDLRAAVEIASRQAAADPKSAIPRSDTARAQTALATALAQTQDKGAAAAMYEAALQSWTMLKQEQIITAEDQYRSEQTAIALENLR